MGTTVIRFSKPLFQELKAMESFLLPPHVPRAIGDGGTGTGDAVINGLFPRFMAQPDLLPAEWQADVAGARDETALARIVCDYVAGMTDRFALAEGERLLGQG